MIHSLGWMMWLLTVMALILSTRNPIYLGLILTGLLLLGHHLGKRKGSKTWVVSNFRFLSMMIFLSTFVNGVFSHEGQTIIFTFPNNWPLIGGNITLEALVYGAINGLVIAALYILFNIINLALSIKQLTRLIPRAFHPLTFLITISLTFFPSIQKRAREIKEAQMIRGNPMKKISDWLPILIPLLVTSLENAFLLAESMTARGFHKHIDLNTPRNQISLILGVFLVFSGWIFHLYHYPSFVSVSLYLIGVFLILLTLILIGKRTKITRFHYEEWKSVDILFITITVLQLLIFVFLNWSNRLQSLKYFPYPHLYRPAIQFAGIIFCLLPLLPLCIKRHDKNY